jgi:hypothetical protein
MAVLAGAADCTGTALVSSDTSAIGEKAFSSGESGISTKLAPAGERGGEGGRALAFDFWSCQLRPTPCQSTTHFTPLFLLQACHPDQLFQFF